MTTPSRRALPPTTLAEETQSIPTELQEFCGEPMRVLGEGSYGCVTLWRRGSRFYAVKRIDTASTSQLTIDDCRREYEVGRALGTHPSIAASHRFFVEGTNAFIVMDYIAGETVNTLRSQRVDMECAELASQAFGAVRHMLHQGYAPADTHGENLIVALDEQGSPQRVTFIDFGLFSTTAHIESASSERYQMDLRSLSNLVKFFAPRTRQARAIARQLRTEIENVDRMAPTPGNRVNQLHHYLQRLEAALAPVATVVFIEARRAAPQHPSTEVVAQ